MRQKLFPHCFKKEPTSGDRTELFHGLADSHGIESLFPYDEKQVKHLIMRASIYRYRHMVYFKVNLDGLTFKAVKSLMRKGQSEDALTLLKDKDVWVPDEFRGSWGLLPNPELDPYAQYKWHSPGA